MIVIPAAMADKKAANSIRLIFKVDDYCFAEALVANDEETYNEWQRQNLIYEN